MKKKFQDDFLICMAAALSFSLSLVVGDSPVYIPSSQTKKLLLPVGSYGAPHRAGPHCWSSLLSVGKAAVALALGDGKEGGHRLKLPLHGRKSGSFAEQCQGEGKGHLYVVRRSQPVESTTKVQRTETPQSCLSAPGGIFCYTSSENTSWAVKGGTAHGRRQFGRFVWSPAVTEDFPRVKSKGLEWRNRAFLLKKENSHPCF